MLFIVETLVYMYVGTIPSSIGCLTRLSSLYIYGNSFIGPIPSEIGQLISLSVLDIRFERHLNGTIPSSIWSLDKLAALTLMDTSVSGYRSISMSN